MNRVELCKAVGWAGVAATASLAACGELQRFFGTPGFFVDLFLPHPLSLGGSIVSIGLAAAVAGGTTRDRLPWALLVTGLAVSTAVLANRYISYSWESKTVVQGIGPFTTSRGGIEVESACFDSRPFAFALRSGEAAVDIFRGLPPFRLTAQNLTARLGFEACRPA